MTNTNSIANTTVPTQSNDAHPFPFTTNNMAGVPYTPDMFTPRKGTHESIQRDREISGLYDLFTDVMKRKVILEWATFQRYTLLFNKKLLETINPMDKTQTDPLRALSEEFLKLINPYKEYHVRMPDGAIHTFPPIYNQVTRLGDDVLKVLDIYDNILTKCVDQPWKREEATALMITAMYESQNPHLIEHQQKKFKKYAEEIHLKLHGTTLPENISPEELAEKSAIETALTTAPVTQGMEYVLD